MPPGAAPSLLWKQFYFINVNFLYKRQNVYYIFRQLGGGKELFLCLLVLSCLQLKIMVRAEEADFGMTYSDTLWKQERLYVFLNAFVCVCDTWDLRRHRGPEQGFHLPAFVFGTEVIVTEGSQHLQNSVRKKRREIPVLSLSTLPSSARLRKQREKQHGEVGFWGTEWGRGAGRRGGW